jgi:hypothetical protein
MTDVIQVFLEDLPVRLAAIREAVTGVLERLGAESRLDAAEAAWRPLSVEASHVIDELRRHSPPAKEPYSCAF